METDTVELLPAQSEAQPPSPPTAVATAVRAVATIRQAALARFTATESHLLDMAARFKDAKWDVSTTKGLEAARADRNEMREQGRYVVQRVVEATKKELNALKTDVDTEGDRLIAIIEPAEAAVDKVIKDREAEVKAEKERKAEKARKEAEAKAALQAEIDVILGYVEKARGKTASAIAAGQAYVDKLTIDEARFGDLAATAKDALARVREDLKALHAAAVAAEAKAAEDAEALRRAQAVEMALQQIQGIQQQVFIAIDGRLGVRKGGTIECIRETLAETEAWVIDEDNFGTMVGLAQMAKDKAIAEIRGFLANAEAAAATAAADAQAAQQAQAEAAAAASYTGPKLEFAGERENLAVVAVQAVHVAGEPDRFTLAVPAAAPATAAPVEPRAAFDAMFAPAAVAAPAPAPAPAAEVPKLKLGELCAEVGEGFAMTEAFIRGVLGVEGENAPRGWLYTRAQRNEVIGALIAHLESLPA